MKVISSTQNPLIKNILQLKEKSRLRKKTNTFVLEGQREIMLALKGGYTLETLLFYPDICSETEAQDFISEYTHQPEIIEVSKDVYQKIAYRETTEGVVAIAKTQSLDLENLAFKREKPLILF